MLRSVLSALLITASTMQAQEVRISAKPYLPAPPALRVETDLVEVGVVVRSHDGHAIPGLTRENFVIHDQGQKREVTYFAVEAHEPKSEGAANATATPAASPVGPGQSAPARPPRFVLLYFEDFTTNTADLKHAQVAGRRFIKEGLDESDKVAIFSTSGDFLDYTDDKEKLMTAINKLKAHPKYNEAGTGCPRINAFQAYQIAVLTDFSAMDAAKAEAAKCSGANPDTDVYTGPNARKQINETEGHNIQAQAELAWGQVRIASQTTLDAIGGAIRSLQKMPGRRLMLLVSSGFNSGSLEIERDHLIDMALRAGIVINAVDAKGLYAEAPGRGINDSVDTVGALPTETFRLEASSLNNKLFTMNQAMSDLAQATGGLFFHNNNDLPYGFRQLGSIPEVSYVLGFHRSDPSAADGKYHKLKVSLVDTKPYLFQARPGYFAVAATPAKPAAPTAREKLDHEVTGDSTLTDFVSTVAFKLDTAQQQGMTTVKAQIHFAIDKLPFQVREDHRFEQVTMVAALLDASGNVVAGKEGTMDFAMTDATYAKLVTNGINAGLNLDAPPGKYRLRAVVREAVEGKMATSTVPIEVK